MHFTSGGGRGMNSFRISGGELYTGPHEPNHLPVLCVIIDTAWGGGRRGWAFWGNMVVC